MLPKRPSATCYRFLVLEKKTKAIIGIKGSHIKTAKQLCSNRGCKITVFTILPDGASFPPNAPDRVLQVDVSSLDDLVAVIGYLMPFFQKAGETDESQLKHVKVLVPEFVCSLIIGHQGESIRQMEKDFNSKVHVFHTSLPESSENVVKVSNFETARLAATIGYIFESILAERTMARVTFYNPLIWDPKVIGNTGSYNDTQYNALNEHDEFGDGDFTEECVLPNSWNDEVETGVHLSEVEEVPSPEEPGLSTGNGNQRKFGGRRDLAPQLNPGNAILGGPYLMERGRGDWRVRNDFNNREGIRPLGGQERGRGGGARPRSRNIRGGRGCGVFRGGNKEEHRYMDRGFFRGGESWEYRGMNRGGQVHCRGPLRGHQSHYRGNKSHHRGGENHHRGGEVFRGYPAARWTEESRGSNNGRGRRAWENHHQERARRDSGRRRDDIDYEMGNLVIDTPRKPNM